MLNPQQSHWLRMMQRIRAAEERIAHWVESGLARTPCHLYIGQEAIATGVCSVLKREDQVWGNHRSHGHYLAKGGDISLMLAEVLCRSAGCSGGRGGSMHLLGREIGILGTVPIVGATVPLAIGGAMAMKARKSGLVSVAFFGDGCVEEGHVGESMNIAAVYRLPCIFVVENNLYSSHMHLRERRVKDNICEMSSLYGLAGEVVNGNDVEAVADAAVRAVDRARAGNGPTLIECRTFRWRGHVGHRMDMDVGVSRKVELSEWLLKCPIKNLVERMLANGADEGELARITDEVICEVAAAASAAEASPAPNPESLLDHVYAKAHS